MIVRWSPNVGRPNGGRIASALLLTLLGASCGGSENVVPPPAAGLAEPTPEPAEDPLAIPGPEPRVRYGYQIESLTEETVNALHAFADKLRVRDFRGFGHWLADDFLGHDLFTYPDEASRVDRDVFAPDPGHLPRVGSRELVASMRSRLGAWRRVVRSEWNVAAAEFSRDDEPWGRLEVHVVLVGATERGGREALHANLVVQVARDDRGQWRLRRLRVEKLELRRTEDVFFSDVSDSTGVAYEGLRYGRDGNADVWNGAAAGDVDGDGRFDLFVPSSQRNFLYRNDGEGGFSEEAGPRGLIEPSGGTGAVFFDFDRDGDQDLVVAHVGWPNFDGVGQVGGEMLQFYLNDGTGHFSNATQSVGFERPMAAYSLTAFDYDQDGWVDLFVCGYGRIEQEPNDSWIEASNGSANALLRNVDGHRFVDATAEAGLDGRRWSYAAAAADYDLDGDQDLYVANNFGSSQLFRNQGDGTFVDVAPELGVARRGNTMGVSWGDLDGDGRLDLYVVGPTSTASSRILNRLSGKLPDGVLQDLFGLATGDEIYLVRPGGRFERAPDAAGARDAGWAWGNVLADFDLDGALDVFCTNGFVTGDLPQDT